MISNKNIFSEESEYEPKIIRILDGKPEVIIISNLGTILADMNMHDVDTSASSNKLLVYCNYLHVHFTCLTKISCAETTFASYMLVRGNAEISYHLGM